MNTASPDVAAQPAPIDPQDITGLILAGGRGSRMGGVDKGLQNHRGVPLALHALLRLQPQVGALLINANRNLGAYESMGVPVWPDASADFPGPLAGFLAGLEHCETPWLVTVPCDSPDFPPDLVARLAAGLQAADADIALAETLEPDGPQLHPVFCLMRTQLLESLVEFMQSGQRRIDRWTARHRCAVVRFDDPAAFFNANTTDELRRLQG
ncbi:MAG: molybdenum cofactor guanylyltransferase MobA [Pseudomonadota bacterium]|jgi:molybdopterin-guanine dinucleotide biosynthesis protein A